MNILTFIIVTLIQFLQPGREKSVVEQGNIFQNTTYSLEEDGLSFDQYGNPVW